MDLWHRALAASVVLGGALALIGLFADQWLRRCDGWTILVAGGSAVGILIGAMLVMLARY